MSLTRSLAAVAAALVLAAPIAAQAAPDGLYGNTLQITLPDGGMIKVLVDKDGTYTRVNADGATSTGTWAETADQICFTRVKPTPGQAVCLHKITQKVGDSWTDQAGGTDLKLTITQGR
jgi:hypothetical protein